MTPGFADSSSKAPLLGWLDGLGCGILHGPDIAACEPAAEGTATLKVGA